jgi:hypothetical protein
LTQATGLRFGGIPEIVNVALLGISLSLGGTNGLGEHRTRHVHCLTLPVWSAGRHIMGRMILGGLC